MQLHPLFLVLEYHFHEIQLQPGWHREAFVAIGAIQTGVLAAFTHARGVGVVFGGGIDLQYAVVDFSHRPDGDDLDGFQIPKVFGVSAFRAFQFSGQGLYGRSDRIDDLPLRCV